MDSIVNYALEGGVATITMDDGKANAMSVRMLQALNAALDRAQADQAVVLLTGRKGVFSGGFDLGVFKSGDLAEQFRMLQAGALLTERLLSFPRPVLAACSGHAMAMGLFIALSADVRIGVDDGARFQANEVLIGMTLPWFAIEVCRARLAPAHCNLVTTTAQPYTPQQAVVAGILDEVAPADSLAAVARARAEGLAKLHPDAYTATKLRVRQATLAALRAGIAQDVSDWTARFLNPA